MSIHHVGGPVTAGAAAVVVPLSAQTVDELFVGRAKEVEQMLCLLVPETGQEFRGVVVAGMGGVGKSALAWHVAGVAVRRSWFSGGAAFVDLRGYDPAPVQAGRVFAPLLRVLGVSDSQVPLTQDEQAALYHQLLDQLAVEGRPVLLILDNAAQIEQVADLLPRHAGHRVVITTRDTLALSAVCHLNLNELEIVDAVELLRQVLGRRRPDDRRAVDDAEIEALTERCGRLPLAVEIAAALLADEPTLSVTDLRDELADASTCLDTLRRGEQAVATVFDRSWQSLSARVPQIAALLPLLSLNFGPDLSTGTAAALAGQSLGVTRGWLRTLRNASLLRQSATGRWQLHDLIRLYAWQQLPSGSDLKSATERMLLHYINTSHDADCHLIAVPDQPAPDTFTCRQDALDWFDAERVNLLAVAVAARSIGWPVATCCLAISLSQHLEWRHHLADWVAICEHGVAAAIKLSDVDKIANCSVNLGAAYSQNRLFDDAIVVLNGALSIFEKKGDRRAEGHTLNNVGISLRETGKFDDAIDAFNRALDLMKEFGDRGVEAQVWNNLGNALLDTCEFERAITAYEESCALYRAVGDARKEGRAWIHLARALNEMQRPGEAIEALNRAQVLLREAGDIYREGLAWNNLGNVLRRLGRFDSAIESFEQALALLRKVGDRHREGIALNNLGKVFLAVQEFERASTFHEEDRKIFQEVGDRRYEGHAWCNIALAWHGMRKFDGANNAANEAVAAFEDAGDGDLAMRARKSLTDLENLRDEETLEA